MKSEISVPEFEQLVRRTLIDVAATTPIDGTVASGVGRQPKMQSKWLRAAAAMLIVAGIGGLIATQRQTNAPPAAQYTSAIDPIAHLFVLPEDTQGVVLSGGRGFTARPDAAEGPVQDWVGFVMGTELSDRSFTNLVQVGKLDAIPDSFGVDGTTEIDTPTGPAIVDESFGYRLAQQRGDSWLLLSAMRGNPTLVDALDQITIGPAGMVTLDDGPMSIIERFQRSSTTVDYSTYYEITDASTDTVFVVETATTSSVVALGASSFATARPTSVNGTPAWLATREGDPPEGVNAAVVWRATPNRIIAISAHAQPEVVEAMAVLLQEVSAETWSTALPGAVIEN